MALLADYEKASVLTRSMLDAARLQAWDELTMVATKREKLLLSIPEVLPPLPAADRAKVVAIIQEMLAAHTEIEERARPWLEHAGALLAILEAPAPAAGKDASQNALLNK